MTVVCFAQSGRHPEGTRVHFSANRRFLAVKAKPENMDLSPSFLRTDCNTPPRTMPAWNPSLFPASGKRRSQG
jgi:hypothetical protein